jgi:DNA-binding NarL/FixJ family response regulator
MARRRGEGQCAVLVPEAEQETNVRAPFRTSVLIVDEAACFRRAARELLDRRGYIVTGEADSAAEAMHAVKRLVPDAILLDTRLPDGSGFELSALLTCASPAPAVLLVAASDFPGCHALAKRSGARGFVVKSALAHCELTAFWPSP